MSRRVATTTGRIAIMALIGPTINGLAVPATAANVSIDSVWNQLLCFLGNTFSFDPGVGCTVSL
jgi:hypothetical protein